MCIIGTTAVLPSQSYGSAMIANMPIVGLIYGQFGAPFMGIAGVSNGTLMGYARDTHGKRMTDSWGTHVPVTETHG